MQQQLNHLMEDRITLYGASGHGKVVLDLLKQAGYHLFLVLDDDPKVAQILGEAVIKSKNYQPSAHEQAIISIGNNRVRERLAANLKMQYITAIHPSAILANDLKIGAGSVVMARATINPGVAIGMHCIINTSAIIEHDNQIDDFVHISPGVSLAGNVTIGRGSHIGIGAVIIQGITIGKYVTVGAGAVIIRDVPDYAVVVGNPGKIIKYNHHE